MTCFALLLSSSQTVGVILAAMAVVAWIETAIPLRPSDRWHKAHRGPNLALTMLTFATNIFFNASLMPALIWAQPNHVGVLQMVTLPPLAAVAIVVLGLDFSFYVAHVSMHRWPGLWRFHSVHHSDQAVDVTTTIRQHPGEGVIRYAFMGAAAIGLGASPAAFAVYRVWSALNGLLEHANVRLPLRLDSLLSLVVTTPNMHKVHHSRTASQTDTNYGNIFSLFDRLFRSFTPSGLGVDIVYGLDGADDPATQTTTGLLAMPFRNAAPFGRLARSARRGAPPLAPAVQNS
jgi:sterol desaturase/sphingolipid hydroxylase (fatty acid hydroxylase superfamily)